MVYALPQVHHQTDSKMAKKSGFFSEDGMRGPRRHGRLCMKDRSESLAYAVEGNEISSRFEMEMCPKFSR